MKYEFISADCHIDLIWLPPDLFTSNSRADLRERMPFVTDTRRGKAWVAKNGAKFGLMNGMGSAGREYVPGQIHRSDRMASTGLYDDGRKGIRRLSDPELRLKDQERDGVQAEVLYGVLGASMRLNDDEAATEMLRAHMPSSSIMRISATWMFGPLVSAPWFGRITAGCLPMASAKGRTRSSLSAVPV